MKLTRQFKNIAVAGILALGSFSTASIAAEKGVDRVDMPAYEAIQSPSSVYYCNEYEIVGDEDGWIITDTLSGYTWYYGTGYSYDDIYQTFCE
jgi:CO dehydrogenase/acetyl-CoA synthase alpha subunit